jgi:hypothetical protein
VEQPERRKLIKKEINIICWVILLVSPIYSLFATFAPAELSDYFHAFYAGGNLFALLSRALKSF